MTVLSIHLFGYPHLFIDNKPVKVERRKTLALAVYLAVETGLKKAASRSASGEDKQAQLAMKGCGREALAAIFWPDYPAEKAGAYLRQAIWDFSKAVGDEWLIKDNQIVGFNPEATIKVDVNAFRELYTRQNTSLQHQATSTSSLTQLVDLYQDDFLAGFTLSDSPAFDDWQALHTETLRLQLTVVLEELVDRLSAQRQFGQAIQSAMRWLSLDPLNETCHRALMQLYADNNQSNAALQQYENCVQQLKKELGIEPSAETVSLYQRIRSQAGPAPIHPAKKASARKQAPQAGTARPTGTVTFLFTDIEGSTQLWERHPKAMRHAFKRQEAIVRQAMTDHQGYVYKMIGDAFQVAFSTAPEALRAALAAQRGLKAEDWGEEIGNLKVRMALHTGVTEERGDDYVGPTLNRVARILSAGYGGQILLNQPTYEQLRDQIDDQVTFLDMGEKQLKDLVQPEHIYQVCVSDLLDKFPPLKTQEVPVKQLPTQTTPFIGREQELAEIESILSGADYRLVTLVGIGGTGKTRLAIQAASQSQAFAGNVFFIGLEGVTSPAGFIAAIADTISLGRNLRPEVFASGQPFQNILFAHLSGQKTLLVLDNFEQLTGSAEVVSSLLAAAPLVKLIVTSRERLNLPGEWIIDLMGLDYPGQGDLARIAQYSAAHLFLGTAERTCGFVPKETDWPAIARICQLLEGIPLGIEMAASWVRLLSCQEIAEEIEKSLDFLSSSWRGMPARHKTIRAVFEHSWGLLTDQERKGFSGLSLFKGGFNRNAVMEVTGISLPVLTALIDKSMVRRQSAGRYEIHPLLNQYASEKLAADPELLALYQQKFADHFCEWVRRMDIKLKGYNQLETLNSLRYDAKNLIAVWKWLVSQHDFDRINAILPAYIAYYELDSRFSETAEIVRLLKEIIHILEPANGYDESSLREMRHADLICLAMAALRHFALQNEGREPTNAYQRMSLLIARVLPDSAQKALALVINSVYPGEVKSEVAIRLCQQSIEIYQQLNDSWGVALARLVSGDITTMEFKDYQKGWNFYQASLAIFKELGNDWGQGKSLFGMAIIRRQQGQLNEAYDIGMESVKLFERINSVSSFVGGQIAQAEIAEGLGLIDKARSHYQILLNYFVRMGDVRAEQYFIEQINRLEKLNYKQESMIV